MRTAFREAAPDLSGVDPAALVAATREATAHVTFGSDGGERFLLDPIPRLIDAAEWDALAAGLDVVRAPDGRFLVLEDNLRTPSGMAYRWSRAS